MSFFKEIFTNRILLVALASWFAAQAFKVIFTYIIERRWKPERFFGLGGMPSSHSSVVCSVAAAIGIQKGFYSAEFALAFVLACVVMTDAAGVRRAAGRQAALLNKLVQDLVAGDWEGPHYERLKELLGHTPFQVVMGALLGILLAVLIM